MFHASMNACCVFVVSTFSKQMPFTVVTFFVVKGWVTRRKRLPRSIRRWQRKRHRQLEGADRPTICREEEITIVIIRAPVCEGLEQVTFATSSDRVPPAAKHKPKRLWTKMALFKYQKAWDAPILRLVVTRKVLESNRDPLPPNKVTQSHPTRRQERKCNGSW